MTPNQLRWAATIGAAVAAIAALGQPTGPTGASDPAPTAGASGGLWEIGYTTPTFRVDGATKLDDTAPALQPLTVYAVGYLADSRDSWITLARRRETRWDGATYYCDLYSIPTSLIVSKVQYGPGTAAKLKPPG